MNKRKTKAKPKRGASAGAPAPDDKGVSKRKEAFDLAEADSIHELMELNGPRVAKWALQCVQKAARGRASLFEQKIALMMIQKSTPSTGRKGEDDAEPLPEGTTKEELRALNSLLAEHKTKNQGAAHPPEGARAREIRETTTYQLKAGQEGE